LRLLNYSEHLIFRRKSQRKRAVADIKKTGKNEFAQYKNAAEHIKKRNENNGLSLLDLSFAQQILKKKYREKVVNRSNTLSKRFVFC